MPTSRRLLRMGCGVLVLLAGVSPLHAQGLLERARQATIKAPPAAYSPPKPSPAPSSSSYSPVASNDPQMGEAILGMAALAVIAAASPFWVPHLLVGDDLAVPGYFPGSPYGLIGADYMAIDSDGTNPTVGQEAAWGDPDYLKTWAVRLALEDGNDFGGLNRLGGRFFFDTTSRFGLASNWSQYYESQGGRSDETLMGDTELTYRFAQRDWLQMHTGLGFRVLSDPSGTHGGVNFVYGADLYPVEPLVVSSSIDLGNLGAAFVVHGRLTAGFTRHHWELLAGYDFLRIGSVNLQGPLLGVRFWF